MTPAEIPFFLIDDKPLSNDDCLNLAVGIDAENQMVLLTQGDPREEGDYDLIVMSLSELERFIDIVKRNIDAHGTLTQPLIEASSVQ